MNAKLVILAEAEKRGLTLDTLIDKDFSQISFLNSRESIRNDQGVKISKSYYLNKKKEAVRIVYSKIFGDYEYNGQTFENVFLGVFKKHYWVDYAGMLTDINKEMKPYYFNLFPKKNSSGDILGFTSLTMESILNSELKYVEMINRVY